MKYEFDKNKINIFTLLPYKLRNNEYIKKCIESWKKIPNANVYLFDAATDIRDTFPGMLENDKYYKILNDTNDDSGKKDIQTYIACYDSQKEKIIYTEAYKIKNQECSFSTDILRLKMLQEIPNAVYIDSDIYIYDVDELLYVYRTYDEAFLSEGNFIFVINKNKSENIQKIIDFYENEIDKVCADNSVLKTFETKYKNEHSLYKSMHLELYDTKRLGLNRRWFNIFARSFFMHGWYLKSKYKNVLNKIHSTKNVNFDTIDVFWWNVFEYGWNISDLNIIKNIYINLNRLNNVAVRDNEVKIVCIDSNIIYYDETRCLIDYQTENINTKKLNGLIPDVEIHELNNLIFVLIDKLNASLLIEKMYNDNDLFNDLLKFNLDLLHVNRLNSTIHKI